MILVYIAGPYRGKSRIKLINRLQINRNIIEARKVARELWKNGYACLCPHSNTALFDGVALDKDFLDGDIVMLSRCDLVVLVKNWQESSGTIGEIRYAHDRKIPVYEWDYEKSKFGQIVRKGEV